MNTVQLECFVTVAEYMNFSKASQVLKITQPAVSHQIRALEKELDVKLFSRTSKTVSLTREGVQFLGDAQLILKTAMSAKERLGNRDHYISLILGCHNIMELSLFPPVLRELAQEYPLLRPDIRMIPFPSLMGLIENDQVHAALGLKDELKASPLFFRELCCVPLACVCSPEHPLAGHETITKAQLTGSFIACSPRQIPEAIFSVQGMILSELLPEHRYFAENIESAFALAKAQMGYALYPDIIAARDPDLRYIPVTDLPKISFGVYYRYNQDLPALKRFVSLLGRYISQDVSPRSL